MGRMGAGVPRHNWTEGMPSPATIDSEGIITSNGSARPPPPRPEGPHQTKGRVAERGRDGTEGDFRVAPPSPGRGPPSGRTCAQRITQLRPPQNMPWCRNAARATC